MENIKQSKKDINVVEAIIANISHELRTPLNAINGFFGLLQSGEPSFQKQNEFNKIIRENIERLQFVMDNIFEMTMLKENRLTIDTDLCNMSEILKSTLYYSNHLKIQLGKKDVAIICDETNIDKIGSFLTDDYRIKLIMKNLLNNALKNTEQGFVEFGCMRKEGFLEFFVKDTGNGITDCEVFGAYKKRGQNLLAGPRGLGIGLYVCEGLLEKMNGKIWFENHAIKGTTFYFSIPYLKLKTDLVKNEDHPALYAG